VFTGIHSAYLENTCIIDKAACHELKSSSFVQKGKIRYKMMRFFNRVSWRHFLPQFRAEL